MAAARAVSKEQRRRMIADAAYFRAERRGFVGGDPVADWLEAEAEIDASLRGRGSRRGGLRALGTLDERLATANERLETLRAKLAAVQSDAAEEWREDVERLARLREELRRRIGEVRERGARVSEEAEQRAEQIWNEISALLHRVSRRHSDTDEPK